MFINIWPFSTIRKLRDRIKELETTLEEWGDDRYYGRNFAKVLENEIGVLKTQLAQAQKNDMPRGPNGRFISKAKDMAKDARGVTIIEYGLIAAMIAVALVVVLGSVGDSLNDVFSNVNTAIESATEDE